MEQKELESLLVRAGVKRSRIRRASTGWGACLLAPCPFHKGGEERRPAFYWNLDTGFFYCFACGAAGHPSTFVRRAQLVDLPAHLASAVELSALRYKHRLRRPKEVLRRLPELPEYALAVYRQYTSPWVSQFSQELLTENEIGFDPLKKRTTIALRDDEGRLVGVLGRLEEKRPEPKYLIYSFPELEIPPVDKSLLLWRYDKLWVEEPRVLALTEGVRAALSLLELRDDRVGVVAALGSRLSVTQVELLAAAELPVLLLFDWDRAGETGAESAQRYLKRKGLRVFRLRPKEDVKQVDELSLEGRKNLLKEVLP